VIFLVRQAFKKHSDEFEDWKLLLLW
jgi:hypothetical protein